MLLNEVSEYTKFELVEGKTLPPGTLGLVRGEFFFPNVPSRNKRIYPLEAWKNALQNADFKRKLSEGVVFGTVGHLDLDMDKLISDLKVSHKLVSLNINEEGHGIGEAYILDSPVGKVLHNIMRSGSSMAISSKADGKYTGKDNTGTYDLVDAKTFTLDRFDFVTDPGFLEAKPDLKEKLEEALIEKEEEYSMDLTKIVESLTADKITLQSTVTKTLEENESLKTEVDGLKKTKVNVEALTADLKKANEELEIYKCLGEPTEVSKVIENWKKVEEVAGDPEKIVEVLKRSDAFLSRVHKIGTLSFIETKVAEARGYEVEKKNLGSVSEIKKAIQRATDFIERIRKKDKNRVAEELSAKSGVSKDKVLALLEKQSVKVVTGLLEDMKEAMDPMKTEDKTKSKKFKESFYKGSSRAARIFGSM